MNRSPALLLALLLLCTASVRPSAAPRPDRDHACSLSVRVFDDPPYSRPLTDGTAQGLDPELVAEALRRLGCDARYRELPWPRALIELEAGRLDILPNAFRTAERERYALFSHPVLRSRNVLFVRAGAAMAPARLADVIGTEFRLGVQPKASYSTDYEALLRDPRFAERLVTVPHLRNAFQMLGAGRLDGLLGDEYTGFTMLRELSLEGQVTGSGLVVGTDLAATAFSRRTVEPDFVQAFDRALDAMRADGSYARILSRHLPCEVSAAALGCR